MSATLVTRHLSKSFGGIVALDDVSLSVPAGQFAAVFGPSGSGTSTLIHIVGCVYRADSGTFTIDDYEVSSMNDRQLAEMRRSVVATILRSENLISSYSVHQNLELPFRLSRVQVDVERMDEVVEAFAISSMLDLMPHRLTPAQHQRVAIARSLMMRPGMIVADEPTHVLDSSDSAEIVELLRMCAREFGQTVLMASHDIADVARSERVILLNDGRLAGEILQPTPRSILTTLESLTTIGGESLNTTGSE